MGIAVEGDLEGPRSIAALPPEALAVERVDAQGQHRLHGAEAKRAAVLEQVDARRGHAARIASPHRDLEPGRQPFHTLNPALAALKDGRVMAYGCMGGDGQPQTQGAVFTRYVDFREPLFEAIDRPRWVLGRTWGTPRTALRMESRFDEALVSALIEAGHDVEVLSDGYSDVMGHAGAVVLHPNASCEGAHDPRADGGAAGV